LPGGILDYHSIGPTTLLDLTLPASPREGRSLDDGGDARIATHRRRVSLGKVCFGNTELLDECYVGYELFIAAARDDNLSESPFRRDSRVAACIEACIVIVMSQRPFLLPLTDIAVYLSERRVRTRGRERERERGAMRPFRHTQSRSHLGAINYGQKGRTESVHPRRRLKGGDKLQARGCAGARVA